MTAPGEGVAAVDATADAGARDDLPDAVLRGSLDSIIDGYGIYRGVTDETGAYVDAIVVYANETWRRQFGPTELVIEGRSLYSFPGAGARFDLHRRVFETGHPFRGFVTVGTGDATRELDLQLTRFGDCLVGSSRDITDQRRAEAALAESERHHREVIAGLNAVVRDDDLLTGESFLSRQVEALTGYPPDVFQTFEFWSGLLHPADRERVVDAITGDDDADIEYRLRVADGSYRWFRDRLTVVRDEAGETVRRYGLMLDVTERHELEERVRRSERLSSIGQLAASVSHDFDNVLYGIRLFAEHLAASHPDDRDPVRTDAEAILHAVESASGLTGSLLAFAREQPATDGRVVPDDLVERLGPMLGAVAGSRIAVRLALHAPGFVAVGDGPALEQAVLNLAINAHDAMADGGELTVRTAVLTLDDEDAAELDVEPGRGVLLEVIDTGAGMDEEARSRAFEPYFTTKPVGLGTGLGLAAVFGTVKRSRGGIAIESAPGRGTTVRVFLPAAPPLPGDTA